jgi:hypothetical protein
MYSKEKQDRISKEFSRLEGKIASNEGTVYKFGCQLQYFTFDVRITPGRLTDGRVAVSPMPYNCVFVLGFLASRCLHDWAYVPWTP